MAPVWRLIITTVEMSRKLSRRFPSGISETPLATVHTSRSSWTAVMASFTVHMLPASPLPDDVSIGRHLDKIRAVHLAIVILRTRPSASDLVGNLIRKRLLTNEKDVSV